MDPGNEPPQKPPAHVLSDKEFDARYNEVFTNKNPHNNFVAMRLGAISLIQLPGQWTERSRNRFLGGESATAFEQGDKVVTHLRGGGRRPEILAFLKEPPHKFSESQLDSLSKIVDREQLVAAEVITVKGKNVLRIDLKNESGSEIRLFFASGPLHPDHTESLSFESTGNLASLEKDLQLATKTLLWNPDRERPGWTPKNKG